MDEETSETIQVSIICIVITIIFCFLFSCIKSCEETRMRISESGFCARASKSLEENKKCLEMLK